MPQARSKKYQLTWMDSSRRWRKKYRGKPYYFPARDDETKATSYKRCWQLWLDTKREIDSKPDEDKPHASDYAQAIDLRQKLVDWHIRQGELDDADKWQRQIADLQRDFSRVKPPALNRPDGIYVWPDAHCKSVSEKIEVVDALDKMDVVREFEGKLEAPDTIAGNIDNYLASRRQDVAAGQIKASGYDGLQYRINLLRQFAGNQAVASFGGAQLDSYRSWLLGRVDAGKLSESNAAQSLNAARAFIRWLKRAHHECKWLTLYLDQVRSRIRIDTICLGL